MRRIIRTYCLLVSLLFVSCLLPGTGANSACAEVSDTIKTNRELNFPDEPTFAADSLVTRLPDASSTLLPDTTKSVSTDTASLVLYKPDPQKAIWYSALCPGLGQLYNRRYWKLPLVGAAVVGVAYAIGWNQKYYNAYTNAYRDITDNDPNTKSYMNLLPPTVSNDQASQYISVFKNRQQAYRRQRDLSFIGAVGVYLICLIDAYVDAQLYDFDISPDLSLIPPSTTKGSDIFGGVELSLAFHF
ncbi:MAG TPA: DUF5683 domain-containing protein [Bacteroidales bacterium]